MWLVHLKLLHVSSNNLRCEGGGENKARLASRLESSSSSFRANALVTYIRGRRPTPEPTSDDIRSLPRCLRPPHAGPATQATSALQSTLVLHKRSRVQMQRVCSAKVTRLLERATLSLCCNSCKGTNCDFSLHSEVGEVRWMFSPEANAAAAVCKRAQRSLFFSLFFLQYIIGD